MEDISRDKEPKAKLQYCLGVLVSAIDSIFVWDAEHDVSERRVAGMREVKEGEDDWVYVEYAPNIASGFPVQSITLETKSMSAEMPQVVREMHSRVSSQVPACAADAFAQGAFGQAVATCKTTETLACLLDVYSDFYSSLMTAVFGCSSEADAFKLAEVDTKRASNAPKPL